MKRHLTLLFFMTLSAIALYAGVGVRLAYAAPGDIYNLGALSLLGGQSSAELRHSYGYGINDAGQVAGYSFSSTLNDNAAHAFRYSGTPGSGGAMADLGTLDGTYSFFRSGGNAINNAGQVAGWSTSSDSISAHAFRYSGTPGAGGSMVDLGAFAGGISVGLGINDFGQVTGSSLIAIPGEEEPSINHAFLYTGTPGAGGAMVDLGIGESEGVAINNAGQIAGNVNGRAFLYTGTPGAGGAMAELGTIGGPASIAFAINNVGQVAGDSNTTGNDATHAFLYTGTPGAGGAMVDLGTLADAREYSHGFGINDAGFVVGFSGKGPQQGWAATLWLNDAAHTIVDLDAWLNATSPIEGGFWTLYEARDINNNGLITGYGHYTGPGRGFGDRAFILDASTLVGVPEPATLALLALGFSLLVWRSSRRSGTPMAVYSVADHSAKKEESHDETQHGPGYGVGGYADRLRRGSSRSSRHFSVAVHQPCQPQPGKATKHHPLSQRRGGERRARRESGQPQPDDGLLDRRGPHAGVLSRRRRRL